MSQKQLTAGTGRSRVVDHCQVCESSELSSVLFLGFLPPVNTMAPIGSRPTEQTSYPAQVLRCTRCGLVQLGLTVDPHILFPPDYAYTSGTTRILRENFAELASEVSSLYPLTPNDLVVDVGSNDGTLLNAFQARGARVFGIEPTQKSELARTRGIPTMTAFFGDAAARAAVAENGQAKIVTATNVFAHIEDVHSIVKAVLTLLQDDGLFITESHYLLPLVRTIQFDTIYHEHLRYYSLTSLAYLLRQHGLEVIRAKAIPTHGGSFRVYAARAGLHRVDRSVAVMMEEEGRHLTPEALSAFRTAVVRAKLGILALLDGLLRQGARIYAVGAPSRASTLVNYVGIDDAMLECVLEVPGSHKIGRYMPGTLIPVVDEKRLDSDPPDYLMLLSWHIADELMPKLRQRGFQGKFIVPLPEPRIVSG